MLSQLKCLHFVRRKKTRDEDTLQRQQALANSLLLKVIRIHSNVYGVHQHMEECYEKGRALGDEKNPWRFVTPIVNPPGPIEFSSDEMGMLIAQKDNELFGSVIEMDIAHNTMMEAVRLIMKIRRELTDKLRVSGVEGSKLSGMMRNDELLALQPLIIEVDTLIESIKAQAKRDYDRSAEVVDRLGPLLRMKLGLQYKLERIKRIEPAQNKSQTTSSP